MSGAGSRRPQLDAYRWSHLVTRGDWPGKTPSGVAVAFVLLARANRHNKAWPSIDTIGSEAGGLSRRTVHRQLDRLREAGLIEVQSGKAKHTTNRYLLTDPFNRESR